MVYLSIYAIYPLISLSPYLGSLEARGSLSALSVLIITIYGHMCLVKRVQHRMPYIASKFCEGPKLEHICPYMVILTNHLFLGLLPSVQLAEMIEKTSLGDGRE